MTENDRQFNLGTARRPFTVEITVNPVFDLLVATWSSRGNVEKTSSWSIGEEWLADFRESIHPSIWSELDIVGSKAWTSARCCWRTCAPAPIRSSSIA